MPPSWYGQHGSSAAPTHPSEAPSDSMHRSRYHHPNTMPSGPGLSHGGSGSAFQRSSPPIGRPPSSASTSSTSSYPPVPSGPPSCQGVPMTHHGAVAPRTSAPQQHQGLGHHCGQGIRPMGSAGRYPMPPRNGVIHAPRPINATLVAPGGMQHHAAPPGGMRRHASGPGTQGQPLRPLAAQNLPLGHPHNHHQPFAPNPHTSGMVRGGNSSMHHPVPYRRTHPIPAPGGPYHQNFRRSSFPPTNQHPQHGYTGEAGSVHHHRLPYESPDNQSSSRSPSPPPAPPMEDYKMRPSNSLQSLTSTSDRVISEGCSSVLGPLRECQNNVRDNKIAIQASHQKNSAVDMTADAASILLELRAVIKKESDDHGACNQENSGNIGNERDNGKSVVDTAKEASDDA